MGQLITIREVAARLSVGETTVKKLAREGALPRVKIGRSTRFDTFDVDAFVARARDRMPLPVPSISEGQLRAFHAKAHDLDRRLGRVRGVAKREALELASEWFGRELVSAGELNCVEASRVLEHLEQQQELAAA